MRKLARSSRASVRVGRATARRLCSGTAVLQSATSLSVLGCSLRPSNAASVLRSHPLKPTPMIRSGSKRDHGEVFRAARGLVTIVAGGGYDRRDVGPHQGSLKNLGTDFGVHRKPYATAGNGA